MQTRECHVHPSSLKRANLGPMKSRVVGELVLRPPALHPQLPNTRTQTALDLL